MKVGEKIFWLILIADTIIGATLVGQEKVGGCTWKVQTARPHLCSALKRPKLELCELFLSFYAQLGLECPLAL